MSSIDGLRGEAVCVSAFDLPPSAFLMPEAREALRRWTGLMGEALAQCPFDRKNPYEPRYVPAIRQCFTEKFWPGVIGRYRSVYNVRIEPVQIGGVATEIITPAEGVSTDNLQRVLINLHSGGFVIGAGYNGRAESIPIAALGKFKVVSVDYRMAPEHEFPAATQDVVAVYRNLLGEYEPKKIGIYGGSAGGVLTAQTAAQLQAEGLPSPGAVGMFCGAGAYWTEGDSGHFAAGLGNHPFATSQTHPYFKSADPNHPLVFPSHSTEVLAKFPPALLISATRDHALSSVVHMHSRLVALGIETALHVWEGLGHLFYYTPDLPQSREMYDVACKFFRHRLGA